MSEIYSKGAKRMLATGMVLFLGLFLLLTKTLFFTGKDNGSPAYFHKVKAMENNGAMVPGCRGTVLPEPVSE